MQKNIPKNIRSVMEILDRNGFEPYLVGGCVRDTVMGIAPHDYDITVGASPEQITECFESAGFKTYPLGREFGTVGVLSDGEVVEITPYRTEGTYSDMRHPDSVEFVSDIRLDLARRDFTINAMAIGADGKILDIFGGSKDIKSGIIRCVGNAYERLSEDVLRILRAVRFAARFGFSIEEKTMAAISKTAPLLRSISGERICSELSGILTSKYAYRVLCSCEEIIRTVIPEFCVHQKLGENYGDFIYRLFVCIHTGRMQAAKKTHGLLKLSNIERDRLFSLMSVYWDVLCKDGHRRLSLDRSVKKLLCSVPAQTVRDIFVFTDSDTYELDSFIENGVYCTQKLALKGGDIVKLGRFPQSSTAKVLEAVLHKVAVSELENTYDAIISFLENCSTDFYTKE